ncbi:very short patch repair endonuclease [Desulfococcaceae bacterium HSG8]|nr:very short patch repair endonuclease [Desulfococcaceae bacterium HSG8]
MVSKNMARKLTRSENMARIRGRDTKPELLLRRALWAVGCRYRLHYDLPGRPDLLFIRERLAIFVDGCFWHGCPIHYSAPRTREDFWKSKLRTNVLRDMRVDDALISDDWRVFRVWQHELGDIEAVVQNILGLLGGAHKTVQTYKTDMSVPMNVSEPSARYGLGQEDDIDEKLWWVCGCGSRDSRVLAVSGPGSLRPNSKQRPASAELICRKCRSSWSAKVPSDFKGK